MKLSELTCNIDATISNISQVPSSVRHQLAILGILPNTKIQLKRVAPFGGTFQVQIRDHYIAINQIIAQQIEVQLDTTSSSLENK